MKVKEKVLTATEFKARCLELLDTLDSNGIVITKRGRRVARVLPEREMSFSHLIGSMKDGIVVKGDLFCTGVTWDAQS